MATIQQAISKGALELFALPCIETRVAQRALYVAPELDEWSDNHPSLTSKTHSVGGRLLVEHLIQTLCDFRCAQRPGGGDLRRLMPTRDRVWTLRPPKLRIYGWFCEPRVMVLVSGALESETKLDKGLNDRKRNSVLAFAKAHGLENTMMQGDLIAVIHKQR